MSKTDDYARQFANLVIRSLESHTAPWTKPWKPGEVPAGPHNGVTNRSYRGGNYMNLLMTQHERGYQSAEWLTFKQIAEEGGTVRRGQKGTSIQFWKTTEPSAEQMAEDPTAMKRMQVFYFTVFNRDQCDGLPEPKAQLQVPEQWRHEKCEQMMTDADVPFNFNGGDRAYYRPDVDQIFMPSKAAFDSQDGFYATALHELGHSTGHKDRLGRDLSGKFASESYAIEELRAEIFSFMCGERLGIGHDPGQHMAYIKSWIKVLKDDPKEILRACADAEKICNFLKIAHYLELQQSHVQGQELTGQEPVQQSPVRSARVKPVDPLAPELLDDQIKDMKSRRKAKELAVAL
ncbi:MULTISPECIES: zincin-like metallopeptidase domain-containing protein [unclassified Stenotrophomonas]|jgi:antirestriction protein ArdC|uniref:ArdC family protein n=1 Tax=unclassified Stenotrophomonas TaxID=196198 RepID=UPI003012BB51